MKKNILVFGSISGLIIGIFLVILAWWETHGGHGNYWTGYGSMIIALSLIFAGVKNFRDKYNGGTVGFGKALLVGLGITLVASTFYVLFWVVDFYVFIPDFMDKYSAQMISDAQHSGLSQAALDKKLAEIQRFRQMYKSPVWVVLLTYLEIVPVGVILSLLTALILRRRSPRALQAAAA